MFGGKFNIAELMKNAKKMQQMMEEAQAELEKIEVNGESGAGAVKVTMNAKHVVRSIQIDDEIIKEEKAVLEDLIAAAINDAVAKVAEITKSKMGDISSMLGGQE